MKDVLQQPALNKVSRQTLDEASSHITDELHAPKMPVQRRKHGRPEGGRVILDAKRINMLPELCGTSEVARVLGVARASLLQWCERKTNPLPFVMQERHRYFSRDVVLKWLKATQRYGTKNAK